MNMIGTICKKLVFITLLVFCVFWGWECGVVSIYAYTQEEISAPIEEPDVSEEKAEEPNSSKKCGRTDYGFATGD